MKIILPLFLCFLLLLSCTKETKYPSRTNLNLNFENSIPEMSIPDRWHLGGLGWKFQQDHETKYSGRVSLKVEYPTKPEYGPGIFTISMSTDSLKGKKLELTGWVKTEKVNDGYAGLWLRINGENSELFSDNMDDRGLGGTKDWIQVKIEADVEPDAHSISFGGQLTGSGIAWFDNFEIYVNGEKYKEKLVPDFKVGLTKEEEEELRKYIYPLKTYDPYMNDTKDLKVLDDLIGDSRVVALGEVTHGSSEIFKMKNRIIQYLAENKGFDIFSVEAGMPESYRANEYIKEGQGEPVEFIKGLGYWTWNTYEFLNMVNWMRFYNQPLPKMTFTGFDMQSYKEAVRQLEINLNNNGKIKNEIISLKIQLENITNNYNQGSSIVDSATSNSLSLSLSLIRGSIQNTSLDNTQKNWLLQNCRIIEQYANMFDINDTVRDKYMAENLLWIKDQNPSSKIITWGHNGHIMNYEETMGGHLTKALKEDYVTFGFAFYGGNYTGIGDKGLTSYQAITAYPGTLEYLLNLLNEPVFILDVKKIKDDANEKLQFITKPFNFRNTGGGQSIHGFYEVTIIEKTDYLIFIKESTPSQLLK